MLSLRYSWLMTLAVALLVGSGCSESPKESSVRNSHEHDHDHDHDGHSHGPESLKDAMKELTSLRDTIRDSFAKNDLETADDRLHAVGHVLAAIPVLAKKEQVSAENQSAIEAAVNTLMDAFGNVDKTMHGQEGSTYSEESEAIDTTLAALSVACGIAASAEETAADAPVTEAPAETPEPATEEPADPTTETP